MENSPAWLSWAREIYSISKAGLAYGSNEYDLQRYRRLEELSAEILAGNSQLPVESILHSFSMQAGYATPKIDVRGAVICNGKILLVQEKADGRWSMPGGWADLGDAPAAMVAREIWEESGFIVKVERLLAVFDGNRIEPLEFYHAYKLVFLCSIISGKVTTSIETLAVDFFDPQHLPALSEARTNQRILDEVFAQAADLCRPAYFE